MSPTTDMAQKSGRGNLPESVQRAFEEISQVLDRAGFEHIKPSYSREFGELKVTLSGHGMTADHEAFVGVLRGLSKESTNLLKYEISFMGEQFGVSPKG